MDYLQSWKRLKHIEETRRYNPIHRKSSIKKIFIDDTRYLCEKEATAYYFLMKGFSCAEIQEQMGICQSSISDCLLRPRRRYKIKTLKEMVDLLNSLGFIYKYEKEQ